MCVSWRSLKPMVSPLFPLSPAYSCSSFFYTSTQRKNFSTFLGFLLYSICWLSFVDLYRDPGSVHRFPFFSRFQFFLYNYNRLLPSLGTHISLPIFGDLLTAPLCTRTNTLKDFSAPSPQSRRFRLPGTRFADEKEV